MKLVKQLLRIPLIAGPFTRCKDYDQ